MTPARLPLSNSPATSSAGLAPRTCTARSSAESESLPALMAPAKLRVTRAAAGRASPRAYALPRPSHPPEVTRAADLKSDVRNPGSCHRVYRCCIRPLVCTTLSLVDRVGSSRCSCQPATELPLPSLFFKSPVPRSGAAGSPSFLASRLRPPLAQHLLKLIFELLKPRFKWSLA